MTTRQPGVKCPTCGGVAHFHHDLEQSAQDDLVPTVTRYYYCSSCAAAPFQEVKACRS